MPKVTNAKAILRSMTMGVPKRDYLCSSRCRRSALSSLVRCDSEVSTTKNQTIQYHSRFCQFRCLSRSRVSSPMNDVFDNEFVTPDLEEVQDIKTSEDMDFYDPLTVNYYPSQEDHDEEEDLEEAKRQAIRDELDTRSGRLWKDRWELTDEDWSSGRSYDDLPSWSEELCSRVSRERVRVHPGESGIFHFKNIFYFI